MPDVVVVGAGVAGAAAAYYLACQGIEVTIVDREDLGAATPAGAGIIMAPLSADGGVKGVRIVAEQACHSYGELIERLACDGEADTGYSRVGALVVVSNTTAGQGPAAIGKAASAAKLTRLDGDQARALFPLLREEVEVLHLPEVARVDGGLLRRALLAALQRRGAELMRGSARLLVGQQRRVTGVDVDGVEVNANIVIAATGAWDTELGLTLGVYPRRGQVLHLTMARPAVDGWPVVIGRSGHYLVAFEPDRVVAGATHEDVGFDYRATDVGRTQILADAVALAPSLASATVRETRIGFRAATRDDLPILGPISGRPGLFVVNDLGADGLTLGPLAGALVADVAVGGETVVPIASFDPGRATLRTTR